ncbi:MAG: hypothetical protein GX284_12855 [Clostridiales bacterium]|uniref:hypothetical protein n=1 Tax=Roseburia sp. MSJ-14 TaxID=2841514 RepID=UPI0016A81592|nr:hypothetical protein [Roseburia sp. MSJ-14]NLK78564.1 hypothetical protein [Clostridiales bacterium]
MRKKVSMSIVLIIFLSFIGVVVINANNNVGTIHSEEKINEIEPYKKELKKLNKKWGTSYKIECEEGDTEQEIIDYFTSMSIEEFREYMQNVHIRDMNTHESSKGNNIKIEENNIP